MTPAEENLHNIAGTFAAPILSYESTPTLRDQFAMAAISGAVDGANWSDVDVSACAQASARVAYAIADAMLAERAKK